jgi:putative two-component system response regulator
MNHILVVDDDTDLLMWIKAFLVRKGYKVTTTTTCSEALSILETARPDIIFLDINVGHEDGRETCRAIKKRAEFKHIPVILISANHEQLRNFGDYSADTVSRKTVPGAGLEKFVG